MRLTQWFEDLGDDVAVALRQLKASPAFALVAVLTLALGIGANSAMFALADATLLRPLPFAKADRLVTVSELRADGTRGAANPLDVVDWIERNHTFDAMAGVINSQSAITWPDGIVESIPTQAVTTRFFDVLGTTSIVGRTFLPSDDRPMPDVAVLAEGLWRSHFGSDTTLIGRQTRLAGRTACSACWPTRCSSAREFGVRIALGANAANVLRLVMASASRVVGIGVAIGLGAAALLSRSLATFLFGVQPLDPMTFLLVPIVLIATAAIAVAAPAWRAARIDPVVAFRSE